MNHIVHTTTTKWTKIRRKQQLTKNSHDIKFSMFLLVTFFLRSKYGKRTILEILEVILFLIVSFKKLKTFSVFPYSYRNTQEVWENEKLKWEHEPVGQVFPRNFEFSQISTSVPITYGNTGKNVFFVLITRINVDFV